ncbi:MAG: glycosyltransferase family 39 protein [Phycisphaerales bacterium]
MGAVLLATSVALLAFVALAVARAAGRGPGERFWVFLGGCLLQMGGIAQALSPFGGFERGPVLAAQAVLAAGVAGVWLWRRGRGGDRAPAAPSWRGARRALRDPGFLAVAALAGALLALSGLEQACTPLSGIDELNYHASRACYWLQNGSILPYETHNDRQTLFPYLGELVFAWGLLFTGSEAAGRMLFWLALPAGALGVYGVSRRARIGRRWAAGAGLVYLATPTVLTHAVSLKPDMWQPVLLLGSAYFAMGARGRGGGRALLLSGLMLGLAASVKSTALAMAPGLAAVSLVWGGSAAGRGAGARGLGLACAGGALGLALGGFGLLMARHIVEHGHPLGPRTFLRVHQPDLSAHQMRTHAVRVPLYLLELPQVPTEGARAALERAGRRLAARSGADARLPLELDEGWPGRFEFVARPVGTRFSLAGLVWLPVLFIGGCRVLREAWKRRRAMRFSGVAVLVLAQAPLFGGLVFLVRWMGGAQERFWLGPFALGIPLTVYFLHLWSRRVPPVAAAAALGLAWQVYPSLVQQAGRAEAAWLGPPAPARAGPLLEALSEVPAGSGIVLLAGQNAPDYPLFMPSEGPANRVFPWGKSAFDGARFDRMIDSPAVTHVIVENPEALPLHWAGGLKTAPFVRHLAGRRDFVLTVVPSGAHVYAREGPLRPKVPAPGGSGAGPG